MLRELPGFLLLIGYFTVVPPALVLYSSAFRNMFAQEGLISLHDDGEPAADHGAGSDQDALRWTVNLKYFISLPEYMLTFE